VLRNGARIAVASLTTSSDTVIARDYHSREELRIPFASVERATTRAWLRGILPGAARGALVGGGIGASLGLAGSLMRQSDGAFSDPFSQTIIMGGLGFMFGAPIGAIHGLARGVTTYRFVYLPPAGDGASADVAGRAGARSPVLAAVR
jgi:hypothetical protein